MKKSPFTKMQQVHPFAWLWEPLVGDPGFMLRPMFGIKAVYMDGRLTLCFAAKEEPWRGLLVCCERENHASLLADFPDLTPHPILPKWLYLPEDTEKFDRLSEHFVALVKRRDPRIGILPPAKKTRRPKALGPQKSSKPKTA